MARRGESEEERKRGRRIAKERERAKKGPRSASLSASFSPPPPLEREIKEGAIMTEGAKANSSADGFGFGKAFQEQIDAASRDYILEPRLGE